MKGIEGDFMKKAASIGLAIIFMVSTLSQVSAQNSNTVLLTLERTVRMALENNETYISAQLESGKATSRVKEAISEALPRLNLNSLVTRNWSLPVFNFGGQSFKAGTDNVMNIALNFEQPIYSGGKLWDGLKAARYFEDLSDATREQIHQNVALNVHQAYYAVLLAEKLLVVSQASHDRAAAQLEQIKKFHAAGTNSEYDVLRARVEVSNAKTPVIQAKNTVVVAKANLKSLIGIPQITGIQITGDFDVTTLALPIDLPQAIQTGVSRRADLRAAEFQTNFTDKTIKIARSEGRPEVSLSAAYRMQAQLNDAQVSSIKFNDFIRSWDTSLSIRVPIFDGRQTSARVDQAEADYELAVYGENQLRKQVEVEVIQSYLNAQEARERMAAEAETVDLAERGLAIAQVQYEGGMITQLELIDAQLTVTQVQTNHVTAKHDYAVAVITLQTAQGALKIPVSSEGE
jgi:outer membrane protein